MRCRLSLPPVTPGWPSAWPGNAKSQLLYARLEASRWGSRWHGHLSVQGDLFSSSLYIRFKRPATTFLRGMFEKLSITAGIGTRQLPHPHSSPQSTPSNRPRWIRHHRDKLTSGLTRRCPQNGRGPRIHGGDARTCRRGGASSAAWYATAPRGGLLQGDLPRPATDPGPLRLDGDPVPAAKGAHGSGWCCHAPTDGRPALHISQSVHGRGIRARTRSRSSAGLHCTTVESPPAAPAHLRAPPLSPSHRAPSHGCTALTPASAGTATSVGAPAWLRRHSPTALRPYSVQQLRIRQCWHKS